MKKIMGVAMALAIAATGAAGQGMDLALPDMSNPTAENHICFEHRAANPAPDWTLTLPVREGYRAHLLQQIYRAQAAKLVIETGECTCATRYPSWDAADAVYQESYYRLDMFGHQRVGRGYTQDYNRIRRDMLALCETLETH